MDIIDENKYNEFKNILLGCKNITDASYFADAYIKKNPETRKLIIGMLNGKKYINCKDFRSMQKLMKECHDCEYYEDVMEIIKEHFPNREKDSNNLQLRSLLRIAENKKRLNVGEPQNKMLLYKKGKYGSIVKQCPHCKNHPYLGNSETTYVVCGFQDTHNGYDWKGCKKDWCFACGKMLCKSWDDNKLFVEPNRIHTSECCKKHAFDNKKSYTEEYCQCDHKYIRSR